VRREELAPRPGWRERVEAQGLSFPTSVHADGTETTYWNEAAAYSLTLAEVEHLEEVTEELHRMCVEAAAYLASGELGDLGLPPGTLEHVGADLAARPLSVYGRFDLRHDGREPAKLLEYNADTPTGLVESAVAQWHWLQDVRPDRDQFNSVHDRLVAAWRSSGLGTLHLAHSAKEASGEEWMTVAYMRDTAILAGLLTYGLEVESIGWDTAAERFVGLGDEPIEACFKLYPWEVMLREPFAQHLTTDRPGATRWVEPLWKVVLSNKLLLVALWRLFPGHPNLLPAYADEPGPLREWVRKPLHGREGDNIEVRATGVTESHPGPYGDEGWVYQQWCPLPAYGRNKAVVGSWVVDGRSAGVGVRESDAWVTDWYARFVPHYIDAPAPSPEQVSRWLEE
jgi:glutathionylspermidine synthase